LFVFNGEWAKARAAGWDSGHTDDLIVKLNFMAKCGIIGHTQAVLDIGILVEMAVAVGLLISPGNHGSHGGVCAFCAIAELEFNLSDFLLRDENSTAVFGEGVGLSEHLNKFKLYLISTQ